jgi:signal transduction histidine kinase
MPYSQFAKKSSDDNYRGPDRRDSMAYFPVFNIRLAVLVIALIGASTACINVFFPTFLLSIMEIDFLYTFSAITLGVSGLLALIRWRLDGMARSFWYGVAGLVALVPIIGIEATESFSTSLLLGTVATTAILAIWGMLSEEVDTAPKFRMKVLVAALVGVTGILIGLSDSGPSHEYTFAAIGVFVLLIAAWSYGRFQTKKLQNGLWFIPTLFAIGFAPLVALSESTNTMRAEFGGPMRFTAAIVAIIGSALELHAASLRETMLATSKATNLLHQVNTLERNEAASIAQIHEVRSSVLSIEGGVAAASVGDESELTKAIRDEIERLRNLVAPPAPPSYGPFQILQSLRSTLLVAASSLPVVFDIDEDLVAVGSPEDLAQVVHGLVSNASKYAPGSPIDVSATRDADHILVFVEDRGPGVARGKRDLIFERGWRASLDENEGYGLGLAIARDLITLGGGDLWVTPRPGGGAKFVVSLPRWQGLTSIDGSVTPSATSDLNYSDSERADTATLQEKERREGIKRLGGAT